MLPDDKKCDGRRKQKHEGSSAPGIPGSKLKVAGCLWEEGTAKKAKVIAVCESAALLLVHVYTAALRPLILFASLHPPSFWNLRTNEGLGFGAVSGLHVRRVPFDLLAEPESHVAQQDGFGHRAGIG